MTLTVTKDNIFPKGYRGRLTEGVTYDERNNTLLWVDIIQAEVHRVFLDNIETDPNSNSSNSSSCHEILKWDSSDESIGAICLTNNPNKLIICSKYGIAYGDFSNFTIEYFFKYPHTNNIKEKLRLRSNDGIIDPWGNLWIGIMNDFSIGENEGIQPEGKLYRISIDHNNNNNNNNNNHDHDQLICDVMIENSLILNGLCFNNKGDEFYWTDSLTFKIWKFNYDKLTNKLINKSIFIDLKQFYPNIEQPEPDGLIMTNNGEIYTCVFNSGTILHVDNQGKEIERINIPANRPTCITFGNGEKNNEMFITTGHLQLNDKNVIIDNNINDNDDNNDDDLGGFLFKLKFDKNLNGQKKNIWGGKV